jgi:uncharacterized protein (TIGR02646 family)
MRFINQAKIEIEIDDPWLERAKSVFDELLLSEINATEFSRIERLTHEETLQLISEARRSVINDNTQIWGDLKELLARQSNGKCWYCESKELRSDNAVDHFRPKNRIAESPEHDGYWWLAFDWKNFRLSCTYCNSRRVFETSSGGKHDHFPLIQPPDWAQNPGDEINEINILLDPCNCDDPRLLSFNISGRAIPTDSNVKSNDYLRADKSIEIYHLGHEATRKARKDLYLQIRNTVAQINRSISLNDKASIREHKEKLIYLIQPDGEKSFNSIARAYLRQFRDHEWVQHILDHQ